MQGNAIGDEGAEALRQALALLAWPRLRVLELKGNFVRHPTTLVRMLATVEVRRGAGLGSLQVLSLGPHDNVLVAGAGGVMDVKAM